MLRAFLLSVLATSAAAQSQTPLTFEQFQAFTKGRTFSHAFQGAEPFGVQVYGGNQMLAWWDQETECVPGTFSAGPDNTICMDYPDDELYFCWTFYKSGNGMTATSEIGEVFDMALSSVSTPCGIGGAPAS